MFDSLESFTNQTALITSQGRELTYFELISGGDAWTSNLSGRCLVISLARNTPEFVMGYVGFMRCRIVQLMLNDSVAPEFLEKLIEDYSPSYLFLPESYKCLKKDRTTIYSHQGYSLLENNYKSRFLVDKVELHSDLALLLSTSGTTGSAKLVRLSYKNLIANTESIISYLGICSGDRTISTMPLSYSYGLSILNTHLTSGASIVMTEYSAMSREFWDAMIQQKVTNFGGVPYFYEILDKLKFESLTLPDLRFATQAGGKLSLRLAEKFTQTFLKQNKRFFMMYGQTEATARISFLCSTDYPEKKGGIGQAIPGCEIWLENELGEKITSPEVGGELVCKGENISMGLAECSSDLSLADVNSGILKTGDYAIFDSEGYFSIVGRKSRFLKIFGLRLNLQELEDILKNKGFECACTGTDEKLFIYVAELLNEGELIRIISKLTGVHRNGFQIVKIDTFPRTSSGKIDYKSLIEAEF
jgi:long-chain acyl-CoA synthetase